MKGLWNPEQEVPEKKEHASQKSPTPLIVQTVDHMFLSDLELTLFAQVTHSLTVILR